MFIRSRVNPHKIYLVVIDPRKRFDSLRDGQTGFKAVAGPDGDRKWRSNVLDDLDNVDVVVSFQKRPVPKDCYEAAVTGSGFGGTVVSLSLTNKYTTDPAAGRTVRVLERSQSWVSDELPTRAG